MCKVSRLEALSLRVVADLVWDVFKTESKSAPLEQTLGIKLTNLMNGLADCSFLVPFLNCIKKIASLFQNLFNADLCRLCRLVNSLWNIFKMKPHNLETTLNQLNEYLSLPPCLKLELARILSKQYDSCNLSQMALMMEMGFHCLDFQHYLHLDENLTFINLLKFGEKNIKKLILSKWEANANIFTLIKTQEFVITSFPYLQELNASGPCCNDSTLRLVAKYCLHLKNLDVRCAQGVTDEGIEFLCSPQSAAQQLVYLSIWETKATAKGAENALKHLTCLEFLQSSTDMDTVSLFKSLSEQELVFVRYKEIVIIFTEESEEIYKYKDWIRKLPLIFPNLRHITIESEMSSEPEGLQFLRSLSKIEKLDVSLNYVNDGWGLFPCDNYCTNFDVQMTNLTDLRLSYCEGVCIHSLLVSTLFLRYLTLYDVFDSGCTHEQAEITYPNVLHLALLGEIDKAVAEKCMFLCPSIKTLALIPKNKMRCRINPVGLTNLTHLSLNVLPMRFATILVKYCKNLEVLNLRNQLPESEEAVWFQRNSPFVKVMHCNIDDDANWFKDEKFSP